jgi:hypothetical protein
VEPSIRPSGRSLITPVVVEFIARRFPQSTFCHRFGFPSPKTLHR